MASGRKIVFLGNCQALAIAGLYEQFVSPVNSDSIRWVDVNQPGTAADVEALAKADLVALQVDVVPRPMTDTGMRSDALKVEFPVLFMGFLWPFITGFDAHVKSRVNPFLGYPPYDAQIGDIFLNGLIEEGVTAEEALERYLKLDVVHVADLDLLFLKNISNQKELDQRTGFGFSEVIEAHYRDRPLFLTPYHPDLVLFNPLARGVFERMGAPLHLIDAAIQAQQVVPLPPTVAPLHPGVIRHFGLRFINENSVYQFLEEGAFTFNEFVLRYMRHTWNPDLAKGLSLARSVRDVDKAHRALESALEVSPKSVVGWRTKSQVLRNLRRPVEAYHAVTAALTLDPLDHRTYVELARVFLDQNDLASAEAAARKGVTCFCTDGLAYLVLAEILSAAGRFEEATEAAQRAASFRPGDAGVQLLIGNLLGNCQDWNSAENAYRHTLRLNPNSMEAKFFLAQVLFNQNKEAEALQTALESLAGGFENAHVYALLGHIYARRNEFDKAEAAFRAAVAGDPSFFPFREALSSVIVRKESVQQIP